MRSRRQSGNPESGYVLLAVLLMVALLLVAMAVAAPRIAADIQRDKEQELIHRGLQYKHAIKLYYKKFGRYPTSIDQLESTNNMRFLRKRYTDPMTGKDDWKIVHFGEAHVKAMGFFSQPIANSGTAGSSVPGGVPGGVAAPVMGGTGIGGSGIGGTGIGGSGIGGGLTSPTSGGDSGSSFGSSPGSGTSSSTGIGGNSSSSGNTALGGGPMVGVVSKNTKASIAEYKLMKHYNEWEFVYDPVEDMMSSASGMFGGGSTNGNPAGVGNGFGASPSPSGTNGPGSSGSSPSPFGNSFSNPPQQPSAPPQQ